MCKRRKSLLGGCELWEWWCYSMFHDSVLGQIMGLDQWKCLGRRERKSVMKGQVWVSPGRMMMFLPHGPWLWAQQVSLGQLMASDTQAVAVILSSVPQPSSPCCCRQLHYCGPILHSVADLLPSAKDKWENHSGSTWFDITLSFLSRPALVYVFCCLSSELGYRRPLASPSPWMWNLDRRISKNLADWGCLQWAMNDRVCPGLPRNRKKFLAALIYPQQFSSHFWALDKQNIFQAPEWATSRA